MIEPSGRAPLRNRPARASTSLAPRAGSVLALPSGEIAGEFRPIDGSRRRRHATYELLVSNDTPLPVATFAYALSDPRPSARMTWNAIVVPPYSAIALSIEIALPRHGRLPRVVAELHSKDAQLTLDALPAERPIRTLLRRATIVAASIVLLCVAVASVVQSRPRVVALAAPDAVPGGTPFTVAYALVDSRDAEYVVETPEGMQVRRGRLAATSGAFTLNLPAAAVSNGYDVRVIAHGRLGTASRATHVVALPPPATPAPPKAIAKASGTLIGALSLGGDAVHGGEPIVVDYRTSALAGSVRLIDQLGTVRAEALLNRRGQSILVAPFTDVDQDLRVVLSAERGTARDEAAVPVRVLHAAPAATPLVSPSDAPPDATVPDGAAPIAVAAVAEAGSPIVVRILRHEPALHVALVDATGSELAARDVPPGASSVTLATPAGSAATQLSVVASFARGFGQETVVQPVTLRARANR